MTETTASRPESAKKITPEQRRKKREAAKAAVELLSEAYPEVFNLQEPKPLKVGIHEDLAADEKLSKTKIRLALSAYVRHYNYLSCLVEGAQRVDLKGQPVAAVTAEDQAHAREKMAAVEQAREERKQQAQQRKKSQQNRKKAKEQKQNRMDQKLEALLAKSTSGKNSRG
jgi:ProP effector